MKSIRTQIQDMQAILAELRAAEQNMAQVEHELDKLEHRYQSGELTYKRYSQLKNNILSDRTWNTAADAYELYTMSLRNRLVNLNRKILDIIYNDKSFDSLEIGKRKTRKFTELPSLDMLQISEFDIRIEEKKPKPVPIKKEPVQDTTPRPDALEFSEVPQPVKMGFLKRLAYAFQAKEKPWLDAHSEAAFGGIFTIDFLRWLLTGRTREQDLFGDTKILPSILSYEDQSRIDQELGIGKTDILNPFLLEKQIKELKLLISQKKPEVYKASTLGYLANITVRKLSIYFIEKYPDFFKKVYKAIREANIKMLANTYINIVFFLTLISLVVALPFFFVFFIYQENPIGLVFVKTLLSTFGAINVTFWSGIYYPFTRAKSRRRSINTNLPFAIDHMASVISSGVSPAIMFKLISHSDEYGEVSVEIAKVTNYVEFFGYDILTALKAVALTTPSEDFKEFIDGFVSTIETGGDINQYLNQKSSEALLNYRLERQKYVESLATYSDIYTGVLIAAPLFFVTTLSLVSALGGTIGGLSVSTVITIGTYLIIPGLNILFLLFLEMNQPEI